MRRLIDDVTVSEMRSMRESGMTNTDIANSLGVSYQTVYKHIGAQPGNGGRVARTIPSTPNIQPIRSEPEPVVPGVLPVVNRVTYLTGVVGEYCVDSKKAVVTMAMNDMVVEVPFDMWQQLADEVAAISRNLKTQALTPEIW